MRVISLSRYREAVFRDISWLLNASAHSPGDDIYEFANVSRSVLNFGVPDVCGQCSHRTSEGDFEQRFLDAIRQFEPRILENTLVVQASIDPDKMGEAAVKFEIAGELWAQPANAMLYIKTALDLETGRSALSRGDK